ncbi:MAG: DUF938 domain-containing protein [Rhodobacteraceae bacterium]|nr:DUF938 domain-containing protein [Paracoccaceae bacterium]
MRWQPSDPDPAMRASIAAHATEAGLPNLAHPLELDVEKRPWPVERADAIVCINMIHISPWPATEALFAGAGDLLTHNGVLFTYGPYSVDGDFRGEGNVTFDRNLRARNPAWGIRDIRELEPVADINGLMLAATVAMPANNLSLIWRKTGSK